ncbi:MAG: hypothetical protein KIS78_27935, partial [Labilithrix sp.]|nr:hypothetical protein [Labilithrix sp.]
PPFVESAPSSSAAVPAPASWSFGVRADAASPALAPASGDEARATTADAGELPARTTGESSGGALR